MTLTIDKAGRVILPKPVRDRLGLRAGSDLELVETSEGLMLKAVERRSALVKRGSYFVHTGDLPSGYDIVKAIDEEREERDRKVWGR